MGATGAVLCGVYIPSTCDGAVIVFNPEIDPKKDSRIIMKLGACVQPSIGRSLRLKITNNILSSVDSDIEHKTPVRYIIHSSCWAPEMFQVDSLTNSFAPNNNLISEINIEKEMNRDEIYTKMIDSNSTPILRINHIDVKTHHLIRQLKGKKLVEILDLGLEYVFNTPKKL